MSAPLTLSAEFRKIVEARMNQVLHGIEDTFNQIMEKQKITPTELKDELESLQETFNLLFQKWSSRNPLHAISQRRHRVWRN